MGRVANYGRSPDSVTRWPDDSVARAALRDMFAKMAVSQIVPILNGDGKDFRGADLSGLLLLNADLIETNLDGVNFSGAMLADAWVHVASAKGTVFDDANLRDAQFRGTDLTDATFCGADLSDAEFSECVYVGVNFERALFSDALMAGEDLRGADLGQCEFGSSYGTVLRRAQLFGANLTGAHGVVRGPIDVGEHHPELLTGAELAQWFSDHGAPGVTVV